MTDMMDRNGHQQHMGQLGMPHPLKLDPHQPTLLSEQQLMAEAHHQQMIPDAHQQQMLQADHQQALMQDAHPQQLLPEDHSEQMLAAEHQQQLMQEGMQHQLMQAHHQQDPHQQQMMQAAHHQHIMQDAHQHQHQHQHPHAHQHQQQVMHDPHQQQMIPDGLQQQLAVQDTHTQQLLQQGHHPQQVLQQDTHPQLLVQEGHAQQLLQEPHAQPPESHLQMAQEQHPQQLMAEPHQDHHQAQLLQDSAHAQQLLQDGHTQQLMQDPHQQQLVVADVTSQQVLAAEQQGVGMDMQGGPGADGEPQLVQLQMDPHGMQPAGQTLGTAALENAYNPAFAESDLKQRLERQAAELASKSAEVEALNQRVASQAGEVEALKQQLTQQQQRAANTAELQALAAQLQDVAARLQAAFAEHNESQKQANHLQAAVNGMASRLQRQQQELSGIQAHVQHLNQQILGQVQGCDTSGMDPDDALNSMGTAMDAGPWDHLPDSPGNVTPGGGYMAKGLPWVTDPMAHINKKKRTASAMTPPHNMGIRPRNVFPMQPQHAAAISMAHMGMHSHMQMASTLRLPPPPLPEMPEDVRSRLDPSGMYQGIAKVLHSSQVPKGCQKGGRGGTKLCKACSYHLDPKGEWLVAGGGSHPMLCQWCTKCFKETKDLKRKSDCKQHHNH